MNITVNGLPHTLNTGMRLDQLVETLDLQGKKLAIEVNREIIPRSQYHTYTLNDSDNIEIVQAIGGG